MIKKFENFHSNENLFSSYSEDQLLVLIADFATEKILDYISDNPELPLPEDVEVDSVIKWFKDTDNIKNILK